ncbi:MAG: hypothetical protein OJF60_000910 [Burkholderiaceae bacterium]|nr:MAG: hypothetical protein OJF60_000910 [Burkholderiaceae bacterium]
MRHTPSLRALRVAPPTPCKGAPPAAGPSPIRGGCWHGLLRGHWTHWVPRDAGDA